jgi:hypothetical protein
MRGTGWGGKSAGRNPRSRHIDCRGLNVRWQSVPAQRIICTSAKHPCISASAASLLSRSGRMTIDSISLNIRPKSEDILVAGLVDGIKNPGRETQIQTDTRFVSTR